MKTFIVSLMAGLLTCVAMAGDQTPWSRFRGPNGSGVADQEKPPIEIGPDKNVKWKVQVPSGLSSPIIVGDKLILTAFENNKLYTIAYARDDGKELWRAEAPAEKLELYYKGEGSPAASTCATDGKRIISYFGSCGLFCYDLSGKELWKFPMPVVVMGGDFGSGVSPILEDGLVILVRDETKNARIVALDAATGSLKWEAKRLSPTSYCTPIIWDTPSGKQVVAAGHARMVGYDLKSGEEKWSFVGLPSGTCASPVVADGMVFFAGASSGGPEDQAFKMPSYDELLKMADTNKDGVISKEEAEKTFMKGFFDNFDANKDGKLTRDEWELIEKFIAEGKNAAFALKLGGSGDVTTSHILWKKTKGLPYVASAILYGGQYVMVRDGGIITAYDAKTGNEIYTERAASKGNYYASPVAANGHIYFGSLDGGVTVIKAGTSKPEVVAKSPSFGERISATPAIADNTLYLRTEKHLYAFTQK
jgi:outer membrane protein assembly factor BamB